MPSIQFAPVRRAVTWQVESVKHQLGVRGETAGATEKEVGNADYTSRPPVAPSSIPKPLLNQITTENFAH